MERRLHDIILTPTAGVPLKLQKPENISICLSYSRLCNLVIDTLQRFAHVLERKLFESMPANLVVLIAEDHHDREPINVARSHQAAVHQNLSPQQSDLMLDGLVLSPRRLEIC